MKLLAAVLDHRRVVLVTALLLAAGAGAGLVRLETDNSPEVFLLAGAPEVVRYHELRSIFGSDRTARIGLLGDGVASAPGTSFIAEAAQAIAALPGVETVLAPSWARDRGSGLPETPGQPDALDLAAGLVTGADADSAAASLLVTLPLHGSSQEHSATLTAIRALLAAPPTGIEVLYSGLPPLDEALDRSSVEVLAFFFPLLVGLAAVLLLFALRPARGEPGGPAARWLTPASLASLLVPLAFVGWIEVVVLGSLGWLGVRLNLVLAILPPLILVVALATAIHVATRFREILALETSLDKLRPTAGPHAVERAVVKTFADKGPAILWASVTTVAGFGSLTTSVVGPVRSLGIAAAAAICLMVVAAFTLLPALLRVIPHPASSGPGPVERAATRHGERLAAWSSRRRRPLLAGIALVAALAGAGLPRLTSESNALHYLPPTAPVRHDSNRLESLGFGTASFDLVLSGAGGSFAEGRALGQLSWLATLLREEPGVLGVVGLGDVVDQALRQSPAGRGGVLFGLDAVRGAVFAELAADPRGRAAVRSFASDDSAITRLVVFTRTVGFSELDPLRARLAELARSELPETAVEVSGLYPLLLDTQRQLLSTLGVSFALTLAVVLLCFAVMLRRPSLVLRAAVPNILPVLVVFGAMGWLGVPLDLATVMVASTTLGLVVDDTIHTVAHFRRQRAQTESASDPAAAWAVNAVTANAPAYLITGLVLAAGFGICGWSSFVPIARFGIVSASAIALAVLADFTLVPALFASPRGSAQQQ